MNLCKLEFDLYLGLFFAYFLFMPQFFKDCVSLRLQVECRDENPTLIGFLEKANHWRGEAQLFVKNSRNKITHSLCKQKRGQVQSMRL